MAAEGFAYEKVDCPSCQLPSWLLGEEWMREIIAPPPYEEDPDYYPGYYQVVEVSYGAESFECSECALKLNGQEELKVANLPEEFLLELEEEPDYEPDFGND